MSSKCSYEVKLFSFPFLRGHRGLAKIGNSCPRASRDSNYVWVFSRPKERLRGVKSGIWRPSSCFLSVNTESEQDNERPQVVPLSPPTLGLQMLSVQRLGRHRSIWQPHDGTELKQQGAEKRNSWMGPQCHFSQIRNSQEFRSRWSPCGESLSVAPLLPASPGQLLFILHILA